MDYLGYIIASVLAVGMLVGAAAMIVAMRKREKIKSVELAPWKVKVEFEGE